MRKAHSKVSSEVATVKEKRKGISLALAQRKSPPSSVRQFENIKVTVSKSPAPDDHSSTSSVIESAEEFLRESASKQPLFARANSPREVIIVSSPRSSKMEVIKLIIY